MATTFCSTIFGALCPLPSSSEFQIGIAVDMLKDMLGEVLLAASIVLILKLVSPASFTFFSILGKNERGVRVKEKQVSSENEVDVPVSARIKSGYPNRSPQTLGTVKSYSSMHEYGFVVVNGLQDDVWFSKADVQPDDLRWLRSGCVVTFMMHESVETGYLRARSIELSFEGQLKWFDRVNHYGFVSPCAGLLDECDIWFSTNDVSTPECWMKEGAEVRFGVYWSHGGRARARHVRVNEPDDWSTWVEGHVKFYLSEKGHGFIVCKQFEGGDVWLSQDDLQVGHANSLTAGVPLRFKLEKNGPRPRARDVEVVLLPPVEGVVKSFCDSSSYGFVSCFGINEDVWFAAACVEGQKPQRPLGPGMHVRVEMFKTEDGKLRAYRIQRLTSERLLAQ